MAAVEIPSIMSHVLSYARLIGILLASVILAYVINFIAVIGSSTQPSLLSHGIAYGLLAIVLVVVGAVFNIILGVFEPGIQGARLLYVEYFSKFYTGNGKPFSPFGGPRTYTRPQLLEQHPELKG
jgi:V/A-type H+-transporting ATPase subunit I